MLKKMALFVMTCMIVFAVAVPGIADAKSSYSSPKRSFTPSAPSKAPAPTNNVTKQDPSTTSTKTPATSATPGTTQNRGFFSGGLMKGLLIGGLAGLLFGSLFGNMGFLGDILGLFVNLMAIFLVVMLIRRIFTYFRNRNKYNELRRN
jgi:predicted lipid-binding transport protein (Tim44 family)